MSKKQKAALKELYAEYQRVQKYHALGWHNNLLIWPECEALVKQGLAISRVEEDGHAHLFNIFSYRISPTGIELMEKAAGA